MTVRVRIDEHRLYYDIWKNIKASDLRSDNIKTIIKQDLDQAWVDLSLSRKFIWIFDLKSEGISARDLSIVQQWLCNEVGVPTKNFRVVFTCQEATESLPYPAISLTDRLIYNGAWFDHLQTQNITWSNIQLKKQLVCLMRRPSMSRAWVAKKLLRTFNTDSMILSLGTNGSRPEDGVVDILRPHYYPLIADDAVVGTVGQHRLSHQAFYNCFVNFIVESSSQIDQDCWHSIFVTEKTFKALAWHQFPIWYAVPGTVELIRSMGFDLFDDLFDDHVYDREQDPWKRMDLVIKLLKRVCDQNLSDLRQQHWARLQSNAQLITKIHTHAQSQHLEKIGQLIE